MRRIFLFIFPILIVIAAAFTIFGYVQVHHEEERLFDDLKRKSKHIAEAMELSAKNVLLARNLKDADYLVEKFETRERLQGCVLYDKDGNIFAITKRFQDWKEENKPYLTHLLSNKIPRGKLEKFEGYTVYSYILPVIDDNGQVVGLVEVIHDTSYVLTRLAEIWKRISITLIILVVIILVIAMILHRQIFALPVQRLTEWFTHFQRGETDEAYPIREHDEFGKLASEVEQVALSLRIARRTVSDAASARLQKAEAWTESKLRDLVRAKLGENALFVVSNREPYMHVADENNIVRCIRPASGVVTALHPILCACGGTWIAHGAGNVDKKFVNSKDKLGVPPEDNRYILKRIWLSKEEEAGYYYGFANEGLWPLCHNTHTRPIFREVDWMMYKKVNQRFADSLLEELPAKDPFVFIQDYHFTLLGKMIKEKRPDAVIALFWHIPWPTPESFSICPYQKEILDGMLGCDLIGFHVQNHCNNFLDTANRLLEARVDAEKFSIVRLKKETYVRAFPISVAVNDAKEDAAGKIDKQVAQIKQEFDLGDKLVGVGVDRIDYTKGLVERILAIDRFFEKYPQFKKKVVFIQMAAPSRVHIKRYHDLIAEIDELVEKKNWKHMEGDWKPIIYLKKHFSADEIVPFYKMADFCIVSSLHDGMNLVAKEYIAAKKDLSGMLILSRFTGASRELTDAVLFNPYSIGEFAEAIRTVVEMPADEKRKRMENMRKIVSENNIYRWAGSILTELTGLKKS